jgi:tRNA threonylcarbamoyladenosine biosynthesis protein TsaB
MTPADPSQDGSRAVENPAGSAPAILAIDTTSEFGGVALRADRRIVAERSIHAPDGFSQVLFLEIEQLFAQAGAFGLASIDCFAAAAGPGSFTGVRVGLAAAKGLAEAAGKPIAPISNLRALATFGGRARRITLLDARRGEVYAAVYDQHLNCVAPETVAPLRPWLESAHAELSSAFANADVDTGEGALAVELVEFITFAGAPFQTALAGTPWANLPWIEAPRGLAAAVALCAEVDFEAGHALDPLAADANYVRRSDAEILWKAR